jgi:hypothetical protein
MKNFIEFLKAVAVTAAIAIPLTLLYIWKTGGL